jgi:hypothetical protein
MPVILATWEAEIRKVVVQCQTGQKVTKTPSQPIAGHGGMCPSYGRLRLGIFQFQANPGKNVCETPISTEKGGHDGTMEGTKNRSITFQACLGKKRDPISKITKVKGTGGMLQAV